MWKLLTVVDDDVHGARVLITTGGGTVGVWSGGNPFAVIKSRMNLAEALGVLGLAGLLKST